MCYLYHRGIVIQPIAIKQLSHLVKSRFAHIFSTPNFQVCAKREQTEAA